MLICVCVVVHDDFLQIDGSASELMQG
jgi:hypothetical protein